MDTEQQQLAELFVNRAPLALIEPLATPGVPLIADADGKPPLWLAIELHDDPKVIKLLIRRFPPALDSVDGVGRVWTYFESLPVEGRFSNYGEVGQLLLDCYNAFKLHRFPHLIELCGTSDALEALVAAHSEAEDDLSPNVLCRRESWNKVLAHIKQLPTQATIDELFSQDEIGYTALSNASAN